MSSDFFTFINIPFDLEVVQKLNQIKICHAYEYYSVLIFQIRINIEHCTLNFSKCLLCGVKSEMWCQLTPQPSSLHPHLLTSVFAFKLSHCPTQLLSVSVRQLKLNWNYHFRTYFSSIFPSFIRNVEAPDLTLPWPINTQRLQRNAREAHGCRSGPSPAVTYGHCHGQTSATPEIAHGRGQNRAGVHSHRLC